MKTWLLLLCLAAPAAAAPADHALLSEVLAAHVKDGRVNYSTLKADSRLTRHAKNK